jgi:hypothetical protein
VPGKLLIIAIHGGTVLNGRETSERGPLVTNLVIMSLLSPFPRGVVRDQLAPLGSGGTENQPSSNEPEGRGGSDDAEGDSINVADALRKTAPAFLQKAGAPIDCGFGRFARMAGDLIDHPGGFVRRSLGLQVTVTDRFADAGLNYAGSSLQIALQ